MMHYPGTSVRRLSIVDIARKPWYDESRHAVDPGSAAERMSSMNAARSVERSQPMFDNRPISDDVYFDLIEQDKVAWGQPFNLQVHVQVNYPQIKFFLRVFFF
jgi:transglutaminase 1